MPFRSERQRRYLWARHPDVARRFAAEERDMTYDDDEEEDREAQMRALKRVMGKMRRKRPANDNAIAARGERPVGTGPRPDIDSEDERAKGA